MIIATRSRSRVSAAVRLWLLEMAVVLAVAMNSGNLLQAQSIQPPPVETTGPGDLGVQVTDGGTRIIYGPAYFAQFSVVTANDLVQRIPGTQSALRATQTTKRGFGSTGDQVLVNGKRLSGKINSVRSALSRIQARQIEQIEVIRGYSAGLDVRSAGTVINIVLKGTLVTGYGSWEGVLSHYAGDTGGTVVGAGQISYAGNYGGLNYLISARLNPVPRFDRFDRVETFFSPDDLPFERQEEVQQKKMPELVFTSSVSYSFDNQDVVNLNGRYSDESIKERESSDQFDITSANARFLRRELNLRDSPSTSWEVGGDYEHIFMDGDTVSGLFVYNGVDFAKESSFATVDAGGVETLTRREQENRNKSEMIVRGTYEWKVLQTQSVEAGAELAINTLDKSIELRRELGAGLVITPLFNADAGVKETRFESFASHIWQPRPSLLMEVASEVEYSRIQQRGSDVNLTRSFFYVRPRLEIRYDRTSRTQFRGRVERTVSQLNFEPFVATFIADDNRIGMIHAGNPELVPEKAWVVEGAVERRFANDGGAVTLTGTYKKFDDRIETIPVIIVDDGVEEEQSAPGNIGKGDSVELRANASFRLGRIGLPGAILDGTVFVGDAKTTDPFTGETRTFRNFSERGWSVSFRNDTKWHGLSYGFRTLDTNGPRRNFDIDFRQTQFTNPDLLVFAEFELYSGLIIFLRSARIFRSNTRRERFQFVGNRAADLLLRREERVFRTEQTYELSLRGVF